MRLSSDNCYSTGKRILRNFSTIFIFFSMIFLFSGLVSADFEGGKNERI